VHYDTSISVGNLKLIYFIYELSCMNERECCYYSFNVKEIFATSLRNIYEWNTCIADYVFKAHSMPL